MKTMTKDASGRSVHSQGNRFIEKKKRFRDFPLPLQIENLLFEHVRPNELGKRHETNTLSNGRPATDSLVFSDDVLIRECVIF